MTTLDLGRVMHLLRAVDDHLGDGPPIRVLVGGGVAMMRHNPNRLTVDVDVFDYWLPDELQRAAAKVARSAGLPGDWLNNDVRYVSVNTDGFDVDPAPLFAGKRLVVNLFSVHSLLVLKLLASRDRDEEDIFLLMHKTGLTTPAALRAFLDEHVEQQPGLNWAYVRIEDLCAEYHSNYHN